jgi:hypothetical protein
VKYFTFAAVLAAAHRWTGGERRSELSQGSLIGVGKGGNLPPGRLTSQSVALIVKAYAARLRLDPHAFSGHSLRSGFLTSAAARGASLFKMMDVSRHKLVGTLRGYVRDADAFRDHAGTGLL